MILVVDDDKSIRLTLKSILERNEYEVILAEEPKAAIQIIRTTPNVELVLMDMNYNIYRTSSNDGEEGLTLLKQIKVFRPDMPCILMTAWGSIDLAVRGMRAGAFDFITKPWDNGVLLERIETARSLTPTPLRGEGLSATKASPLLGEGPGVRLPSLSNIYSTVARVAPTNAPVLITGESGTGKELIAEAIHRQSRRAKGPFVKVNLGGISTSLFESEMFGHKKGSFTDATSDRIGRFELARGGTIFLDEIGELSIASQVKLLRVLQDQTYEVLGDSHTRRTDVRVVCATNADLRQMVEEHTFREDLFYRINLINLHLPPLRERREDIPLLVEHFLREACLANKLPLVSASTDAINYLQTLPFPGNIRELKNLVERAVLMHESPLSASPLGENSKKGDMLTVADFQNKVLTSNEVFPQRGSGEGASVATLDDLERTAIAACIQKHNGNLSLVAKELGISRGALYRKIEKHGL
ncbi:MAG: sigma-54-dependent Fis family transcriptional regulator [Bacteroidaceae bacterium]|nr:sigma-54-dependent Fis family transcriptional regulator [Bacteroidaceae bacterium]